MRTALIRVVIHDYPAVDGMIFITLSIERQFCDIVVICEYPAIDDMMALLYFGK